ncbi:hypothetical protein ACFX2H_009815 [Malus domestica]|uniref:Uncharacterized protein n=1 Tax=Malus domestica TaxID=3750 RepID=A0A498IEH0_MALDO|nr:hypothetical protein DVH24_036167 [Malus domestica]
MEARPSFSRGVRSSPDPRLRILSPRNQRRPRNPRPRDQQTLLPPAATDKLAGIRSATSRLVFICLFEVAAVVVVFSESTLEASMNSRRVRPKSSSSSLISKKKRKGKKDL